MTPIKTLRGWIDYSDKILIIKRKSGEKIARFQYDGCSCLQGSISGNIVEEFKSKSKWFDSEWWYKKTCWGTQYPQKIYFDEKNNVSFMPELGSMTRKLDVIADAEARPSVDILKSILKEVCDKTGKKYELDFKDTDYGKHWYESYIPIKLKNKSFLLTWMNCD